MSTSVSHLKPQHNTRILMIGATPFFSERGCHIRIYNEMKYLKKEGVDVTLCTYHLGNDIEGFDIRRTISVPWYKKLTPGASWHKLYIDLLLLFLSYKTFHQKKYSIIHAHLYEGLLIAFIIKLFSLRSVKIVFDCQGSLAEEMQSYTLGKSRLLRPFYYFFVAFEKLLLYIPDITLCSSKNSYDVLRTRYNVPVNKIDILDDGVDTEIFENPTHDVQAFRDAVGIPADKTVVLYTGTLTTAKGVQGLLDALPNILSEQPDLAFVFAGYGSLEHEYKQKLSVHIEAKNVFIMGRVSYFDIPKYTSIADFAIDPKNDSSESSGKLFVYVAAGLPVICFKRESNVAVLGGNGVYIADFIELQQLAKNNTTPPQVPHDITWGHIVQKLTILYAKN